MEAFLLIQDMQAARIANLKAHEGGLPERGESDGRSVCKMERNILNINGPVSLPVTHFKNLNTCCIFQPLLVSSEGRHSTHNTSN